MDLGFAVAPNLGAWIEIFKGGHQNDRITVAPYLGAWIEMGEEKKSMLETSMSTPTWVRGFGELF